MIIYVFDIQKINQDTRKTDLGPLFSTPYTKPWKWQEHTFKKNLMILSWRGKQ